ncbi:MAG TPA: HD-GYP domain-containing protein [Candidatus Limnocylindria bacterium]
MGKLRAPLRVYVLAVIASGMAAVSAAVAFGSLPTVERWWLAGLFFAATAVAQIRPVHIGPKLKVTVEDAATYAAALTLHPLAALLVAAGGTFLGLRFTRRATWYNRAFNASVVTLGTGAAALTYALLRQDPDIDFLAATAAAFAKLGVESALVEIAIALQLRRSPFLNWWQTNRSDMPHHVVLYLLGLLAATALDGHPWALVLFLAPVAVVYVALRDVSRLREQTRTAILELADMIDLRDHYTHGHSQRVAEYAERIARELGFSAAQRELVREAARVHDIGKIGTADQFLLKAGPLSPEERGEMRRHAELGYKLLRRIPEFWAGAELVYAHHERPDGRGYPRGLHGDEVPFESAVISVADAYDAMTTDRPYRKAMGWDSARREFEAGRGTQWDARVVDVFIGMVERERAPETALVPATA